MNKILLYVQVTMLFMEDDIVPETEALVEVTSEPLYCLCQEPWDKYNRRFMIQCDHCKDWFHGRYALKVLLFCF